MNAETTGFRRSLVLNDVLSLKSLSLYMSSELRVNLSFFFPTTPFIKRPVDSVCGVFAKFSLAENLKAFNKKKKTQHDVGQISITNVAWSNQQPRQQVTV